METYWTTFAQESVTLIGFILVTISIYTGKIRQVAEDMDRLLQVGFRETTSKYLILLVSSQLIFLTVPLVYSFMNLYKSDRGIILFRINNTGKASVLRKWNKLCDNWQEAQKLESNLKREFLLNETWQAKVLAKLTETQSTLLERNILFSNETIQKASGSLSQQIEPQQTDDHPSDWAKPLENEFILFGEQKCLLGLYSFIHSDIIEYKKFFEERLLFFASFGRDTLPNSNVL